MTGLQAKVSFFEIEAPAVDALVSVEDGELSLEASGRPVGRWPISELSPRMVGDALVVTAEGEHLVIDAVDPEALVIALRLEETAEDEPAAAATPSATAIPAKTDERPASEVLRSRPRASPPRDPQTDDHGRDAGSVASEISDLETALTAAQLQLRWVQELVPRRLPIPLREGESGLGIIQGVRLKERRPLPGSEGLQPWVVVDAGNVYVTDRRLVFSGAQDVEFEFEEINKKGASRTGLLLGVSSRTQSHILAGPGDRLAVVLTAAEKLARGLDPLAPFRDAIGRLAAEIDRAERQMRSFIDAPAGDSTSERSSPIV